MFHDFVSKVNQLMSTSAVAKDVPGFMNKFQQWSSIPSFLNGRPATAMSPVPVQLMVPAFQHLITASSPGDTEGSYKWSSTTSGALSSSTNDPCSEEDCHLRLAHQFSADMSYSYSNSSTRVRQLKEFLMFLAPAQQFQFSTISEDFADFVVTLVNESKYLLMIAVVKNEAALSGDAGLEGTTYYANEVAKEQGPLRAALTSSFSPVLLLEVVGPQLRFNGLAFGGETVICQPLTPMISLLDLHVSQPEQV